ncbi:MAG TPA: nuclear transport factor 2 family protein [Gaiellaceae bacterium]
MTDLRALVDRYNDAWNRQDLDAICSMHAPDMVFENHNAGERAAGEEVRGHLASIFESWPDLRFRGRSLYVGEDFVVQEWTATATHPSGKQVEWDGLDVFPIENGLIKRKDVYSNAHRRVPAQLAR